MSRAGFVSNCAAGCHNTAPAPVPLKSVPAHQPKAIMGTIIITFVGRYEIHYRRGEDRWVEKTGHYQR